MKPLSQPLPPAPLHFFRVEYTHSACTLRSTWGILPFSQKIFHPPLRSTVTAGQLCPASPLFHTCPGLTLTAPI